ncbi:MAG: FAD-dependent monooxygenase [Chloroflexi bacterium]|nr:FAD-dependent monooxygenase [Chloroflexota bacterium]
MSSVIPVDVLIVGSGPSGISTALHLIQKDKTWANRIIVVDKAIHPREKLCGGGITHLGQNILAHLGLPIGVPNFEVREVRLVYEDKSYSFHGNPVFRIVRRDEFDHWLVKTAETQGVTVRQGEAVKDVVVHDDYVEVTTDQAIFHAKVLVGADGSRSLVRAKLKWDDETRVARLLEVLTPEDARQDVLFKDGVAIFDFTRMTKGLQGYYWDFPSFVNGQPMMNRGVFDSRACPTLPKADLKEDLRDSMAERGRDLSAYKLKGHPIRWYDKKGKLSTNRVILVGDAAGADPLMGEGISFALGYGEPASQALNDAFARQDFSFASYSKIVRRHPLFYQLQVRTNLARWAYFLRYPWLVRLGWQAARLIIRLTPWRNPHYVPAIPPQWVMEHQ